MQLSGLLLAHYDEERDRIRCPILGPALWHVLAQEGSIERLLLIVTEQAPAHPNDTLTAGRLVARRLRDEFGPLIAAIDPAAIVVRENPHAHDRMYTAIGAALFRLLPPSPDARFYALVSGGTPAITDSLRQQSMRIYRGGCTVLHTDEPAPGQMEGSVREVVLDPYTRDMALRSAEELVKEYHYAGASRTLRDFDTKWRQWARDLKPLLSYGIARGNLEFDGAKSPLGESELPYSHLRDSLPDSPIERISEVFFQARVAVRRRRWLDAVYRFALVIESSRIAFAFAFMDPSLGEYQ